MQASCALLASPLIWAQSSPPERCCRVLASRTSNGSSRKATLSLRYLAFVFPEWDRLRESSIQWLLPYGVAASALLSLATRDSRSGTVFFWWGSSSSRRDSSNRYSRSRSGDRCCRCVCDLTFFSVFAQVRFSSAPNSNVFSRRQLQTRMYRVYCRQGSIENARAERMGREG